MCADAVLTVVHFCSKDYETHRARAFVSECATALLQGHYQATHAFWQLPGIHTHTLEEKQREHLFDLKTQTLPYPCFSCTRSIQKLVKIEHFMSILKNAQTWFHRVSFWKRQQQKKKHTSKDYAHYILDTVKVKESNSPELTHSAA